MVAGVSALPRDDPLRPHLTPPLELGWGGDTLQSKLNREGLTPSAGEKTDRSTEPVVPAGPPLLVAWKMEPRCEGIQGPFRDIPGLRFRLRMESGRLCPNSTGSGQRCTGHQSRVRRKRACPHLGSLHSSQMCLGMTPRQ